MPDQQRREQVGVAALVQHVAADDEVETAERVVRHVPAQFAIDDRRQAVERRVVGQERTGQRMVVAGDDIRAAPLQHQAGEAETAAQFQDAFAGDVVAAHRFGQQAAGRPDLAEQAPLRRRDADTLGKVIRIGELLDVAERTDAIVIAAEADGLLACGVARHGGLPEGAASRSGMRRRKWERNGDGMAGRARRAR